MSPATPAGREAQRVIPANRHHQVGRVSGDFRQLSCHRLRDRAVDREQRRAGTCRQQRTQVRHHVGLPSRVDELSKIESPSRTI